MEQLVNDIAEVYANFNINAGKALDGNKAASARSRKLSLDLEKMLKEYRKVSIAAAKR